MKKKMNRILLIVPNSGVPFLRYIISLSKYNPILKRCKICLFEKKVRKNEK